MDDLIGEDTEKLYSDEYMPHWNKLVQQWVRIIYENTNKPMQLLIERFIDPNRIDTLGYFEYFDVRHQDPKFRHLGEFIKEFDKNILKLSDLLNEIWKNKDNHFMDSERVTREWQETKIVLLNSKILENLLTNSIKSRFPEDIEKVEDNFKLAGGVVKMKLMKAFVEKMGCLERDIYHFGRNGSVLSVVPSREFFRKKYDDIDVKFDYHVKFEVEEEEELNDFSIKMILEMGGEVLSNLIISFRFSGGEMSGKLNAKYKFDLADNFNYMVSANSSGE
jgi:CRISPR/Cas system-associated protein Cas5 (RAMP superfamily)